MGFFGKILLKFSFKPFHVFFYQPFPLHTLLVLIQIYVYSLFAILISFFFLLISFFGLIHFRTNEAMQKI